MAGFLENLDAGGSAGHAAQVAVIGSPPPISSEPFMQAGVELADRYTLAELLGYGGMGEVWRGVDRQLHRQVAVKVLRERHADTELGKRFLREARIAARLQHPGITVVHDAGFHDGQLFIVMELLHGCDLDAKLADSPTGLPIDTAVSVAVQAAEALSAAHAVNVIHRDLKPANLFLAADGQLKICDFGIARVTDATSMLAAAGQVIGTPAYMSPEQCEGGLVDGRSDLYSLGCVLYALLTGKPPFPTGQPLAVMLHHLKTPPVALRELRPEVPAQLDRLVMDLLAKDPASRPPDAARVAATLKMIRKPSGITVKLAATLSPSTAVRTPTEIARTLADASQPAISRDSTAKPSSAAGTEAARAERLLNDAEQIAREADDEKARAAVVGALVKACAGIDPVRAEQMVQAISYEPSRFWPLAVVAKEFARTDPAPKLLDRLGVAFGHGSAINGQPFLGSAVGGNDGRGFPVPFDAELVEVGGLGRIERGEREVVQDEQVDAGQAAHLGFEGVVEPGGPEPLEQIDLIIPRNPLRQRPADLDEG